MPGLSASASRNSAGVVHLSLCNVNPGQPAEVQLDVRGMQVEGVRGRVLTADHMTAHNTFDAPDRCGRRYSAARRPMAPALL